MPRLSFLAALPLALCAFAQAPPEPLKLTLPDALARATANNPQLIAAKLTALIAQEDTIHAKAALLPTVNGFSQFIYTQPNGTSSGTFVSNDGPHVYNDQINVHGDIYNPVKRADVLRLNAAALAAQAKADLAARGIVATVVQNFYSIAVAQRKLANAKQSLTEAQSFLDITGKQERRGEAARADVVKAQIPEEQRQRDVQDAQLAVEKSRIGLALLIFTDYRTDFTVVDDLDTAPALPDLPRIQTLASTNNPDIRAAQAAIQQQTFEIKSARAAYLPTLSADYFFGLNANQFAIHNHDGNLLLGNAAQVQLTIPIWTWGATKSKIKQSEFRLQQAKSDLTFTQRELLANLNSFFLEAQAASAQIASLKRSVDLSVDSLHLTVLRYQAGEANAQEVVDAQSTLAQARNAAEDGLVRYRLAIGALQTLTGAF
jgi:outer membrane protein TolC